MRCSSLVPACAISMVAVWSSQAIPQDLPPPARILIEEVPALCEIIRVGTHSVSTWQVLSSPSQTWRAYKAEVRGIPFTVGVDDTNRVRFVTTPSHEFQTPEGVDHSWSYERLRKTFNKEARCETGWACFVELPSGWNARFAGFKMVPPVEMSSAIGSFFKRAEGCEQLPDSSLERAREG